MRQDGLRIKGVLALLTVLFSGYVMAELVGNEPAQSPTETVAADSIVWPMLPGESLNSLAKLFYPDNKRMQGHFVARTLELNRESRPELTSSMIFQQSEALLIPELKILSRQYATAKPVIRKKQSEAGIQQTETVDAEPKETIQPETQALFDTVSAQNRELNTQLQVLDEKLANLQKLGEQLKKEIELNETLANRAKAQRPVPSLPAKIDSKGVRQAVQEVETETSKWRMLLAGLGVVLLLALACWLRRNMVKQPGAAKPERQDLAKQPVIAHDSALDMRATHLETVHPSTPVQAESSIQVIESVVEEAKALMDMNKGAEAIGILEGHVHALPKASLSSWLYLFEIYRQLGKKDEFIDLSRRFHKIFNVMVPLWEPAEVQLVTAKSLEEFPHIVSQLIQVWKNGQAKEYLEKLLEDNRLGERQGFSHEVAHEIVLLLEVWENRD